MAATLAPNTKILTTNAEGVPVWYTTREAVPADNTAPAVCPLTRVPVRTMVHRGRQLWFPAAAVQTTPDDRDAAVARLAPCLLIYDIPEGSDVRNPSGVLRRRGVRINLSCWVIPEALIPYETMAGLRAAGATWHVVRFDPTEGRKLIGMAVAALRAEIRDAVIRADRSVASAAEQLRDADGGTRAREYYDRRVAATRERIGTLLADLTAAAAVFGIDPAAELSMGRVERAVRAVAASMYDRARVAAEAGRAMRAAGGTAAAIAEAFTAGDMPAVVAADFMEENDIPGAETLRAAFTPDA